MTPATTLEKTLDELAPKLLRYCRGRCRDAVLAEDAAQTALIALVDRWRRLGPPGCATAFTFTIARRRLARHFWQRRLLEPMERVMDSVAQRRHPQPSPERIALDRDRLSAVREAISRLSPRLREALLLTVAAELDTATVAEVLGISRSAVKMRVSRARQQLTSTLEDADDATT